LQLRAAEILFGTSLTVVGGWWSVKPADN